MSAWMGAICVSLKTHVETTMAPTLAGVPLATRSMETDTVAMVRHANLKLNSYKSESVV